MNRIEFKLNKKQGELHLGPHGSNGGDRRSEPGFSCGSFPMNSKDRNMDWSFYLIVGVVAGWFVLNRWVLPKMGIPT